MAHLLVRHTLSREKHHSDKLNCASFVACIHLQSDQLTFWNTQASVWGTYALDLSQIRLAHIVFQYTHRATVQRGTTISREMLIASKQPIVTFAHDPLAVEVDLEEALESRLFV